jgi:hypothetical protein
MTLAGSSVRLWRQLVKQYCLLSIFSNIYKRVNRVFVAVSSAKRQVPDSSRGHHFSQHLDHSAAKATCQLRHPGVNAKT